MVSVNLSSGKMLEIFNSVSIDSQLGFPVYCFSGVMSFPKLYSNFSSSVILVITVVSVITVITRMSFLELFWCNEFLV